MAESRPQRAPRAGKLPTATDYGAEAVVRRRELLAAAGASTGHLAGEHGDLPIESLQGRVEGAVGYARVPVGVFGPLAVEGAAESGEVFVPIATTEGALVMSYQHVANLFGRSGGVRARVTDRAVWRSPAFSFDGLADAAAFAGWIAGERRVLESVTAEGSRHARLTDLEASVIGRDVVVRLGFSTGDAAGQNMVTLATQRICGRLLDAAPVKPTAWQLEANASGDKKATFAALGRARGHRATAEVTLSDKSCRRYFRSGADQMARIWDVSARAAVSGGAVGVQGNYANAIAGLFIACGQDVACVAEAAIGITSVELESGGDLYVAATLPNLIVGTVGGGTGMPTAAEGLAMLGCVGEGRAQRFAEICAAVALAGEVALLGALAGHGFASAHESHGRKG